MAGTDIVTIGPGDVERALVDGIELPTVENSEDVARAIVQRILSAETEEQMLSATEAEGWQDYIDRPVIVTGVRWMRSSFTESAPVFAMVDIELGETGELRTVSCGSKSVMAALLWYDSRNAWPQPLKLTATKSKTPDGYQPLRLVKA